METTHTFAFLRSTCAVMCDAGLGKLFGVVLYCRG